MHKIWLKQRITVKIAYIKPCPKYVKQKIDVLKARQSGQSEFLSNIHFLGLMEFTASRNLQVAADYY